MRILVLGGTRYFGVHLVRTLLGQGHEVTMATRGQAKDDFGADVKRLIVERSSQESLQAALKGSSYDVVYDNLAYSSNEVKYLLETVETGRYIMASTVSVYQRMHLDIREEEFDPLQHQLVWLNRGDADYGEIKRQAECAAFQSFASVPSFAVRFPYVVGPDDYTRRLFFYAEKALQDRPIYVGDPEVALGFIRSVDAGQFLAWLADKPGSCSLNAGSEGAISIAALLNHLQDKLGRPVRLSDQGERAPYTGMPTFSVDTARAQALGYRFADLATWMPDLLDQYLAVAEAERLQ